MKNELLHLAAFSVAVLLGCTHPASENTKDRLRAKNPSVVRMVYNVTPGKWTVKFNEHEGALDLTGDRLPQLIRNSNVRFPDLIIIGIERKSRLTALAGSQWLSDYCRSNQVAVYVYNPLDVGSLREVLRDPVFHWAAPFDDPMSLQNASFYADDIALGKGNDGLERTINELSNSKAKQVFLLGSMYDQTRGFPPSPSPFEHRRHDLSRITEARGIQLVILDPNLGF